MKPQLLNSSGVKIFGPSGLADKQALERFIELVLAFQTQILERMNAVEARLNKLEEKPKYPPITVHDPW